MIRPVLALLLFTAPAWAQAPSVAKSAEDAHDLRGIWQAKGNAYRNLEAEKGVIVDPASGKIPFRAEARSTADRNFQARATTDPLLMCFQPGVPRATLLPEPFQIFQQQDRVVIVYQHVHSYRVIFTDGRPHYDDGIEFYMGDSRGRWEGNTLVGHFHSNKLHVIERYTRTAPTILRYEATVEDTEVFQSPWTIRVELMQHTEPNFQLIEHECDRDAQGVYRHPPQFLK
jgi:hypothetical protein